MIEDIKTALSDFFGNIFDKILDALHFNWFKDLSKYARSFIESIGDSIEVVSDAISSVPPIFKVFLTLSLIVTIGYLVIGRGRVD